jgi:hypothetical protein
MNLKIEKLQLFFVIVTFVKNNKKQKGKNETTLKNNVKTKKNNKNLFIALSEVFLEVFLFSVCHKMCG